MKNLWLILGILAFVSGCSDKKEQNPEDIRLEEALEDGEEIVVQPSFDVTFDDITHSYKLGTLTAGCNKGSEIVCAIDLYAKCTIDPSGEECRKNRLPKFVFMEDDSLGRPDEISFKIIKIKPIDANMIEVYTQSSCNGTWFGLCNGNIIYVLSNKSGQWVVKDVYARDNY